jgi:hypothetical protein
VGGSYATTQIFQLKPNDTYATARNFSSLLGATLALRIGALMLLVGYTGVVSLLWHESFSVIPTVLYGFFSALFLWGIIQCLRWSRAPFTNATPQFKSVIFTLLGARLFWIAAEWIRLP